MLCSSPTRQLVPHLQSLLRTSVVPVVVRCINRTLTVLTFRLSGWDLPSLQINGGFFAFFACFVSCILGSTLYFQQTMPSVQQRPCDVVLSRSAKLFPAYI